MNTVKIYGPPGTGKTHTLLGLFEQEVQNVKPDRIGFVTFTRAARLEAMSRTGMTEEELPYVKTLHAICYKLLRVRHDDLVQPRNLKEFGKAIGVQLTGYMPDVLSLDSLIEANTSTPTKADRLLQLNHLGRHRGITLKESLRDAPQELDYNYAKWFTLAYRKWKTESGLLDYTDLLTEYLARGPDLDCEVLFVDEAQDLSWLQWQVVRKLGLAVARRYLAGDDDQAIFIWAGASAEMFNTEPADEVRVLPQSFRIARAIHRVADRIIGRVKVRQTKEYRPRDAEGIYQEVGYLDHKWFEHGSALTLFRNHHRGVAIGAKLEELGIPFTGTHSPLSRPEIRDALAGWQKVERGQNLSPQEARAIAELTPDGFLQGGARNRIKGRETAFPVTSILNADALRLPWSEVLCRIRKMGYIQRVITRYGLENTLNPKVHLLSIHQSKGREADTVVIDMEMARRTYESYMNNPDDEHRVWYVAVTRARNQLYTLLPSDPMCYQV